MYYATLTCLTIKFHSKMTVNGEILREKILLPLGFVPSALQLISSGLDDRDLLLFD